MLARYKIIPRGYPVEDAGVAFAAEADPAQLVLRHLEQGVGTWEDYQDHARDPIFATRSWQHRVRFYFLLGQFASAKGMYREAITALHQCIVEAGATPIANDAIFRIHVYRELGLAEMNLDQFRKSISDYSVAITTIKRVPRSDPRKFVEGDIECLLCSLYYMRGKAKTFAGHDFIGAIADLMQAKDLCDAWEKRKGSDEQVGLEADSQNEINWISQRLFVSWMLCLAISYRVPIIESEDLNADIIHAFGWSIEVLNTHRKQLAYAPMWYFNFRCAVAWMLANAGQIEPLSRETRQLCYETANDLLSEAAKELQAQPGLQEAALNFELVTHRIQFGEEQLNGSVSLHKCLELIDETSAMLDEVRALAPNPSNLELQVFITIFLGDLYLSLDEVRSVNDVTQALSAYQEAQALIAKQPNFLPVLKKVVDHGIKKFGKPRND